MLLLLRFFQTKEHQEQFLQGKLHTNRLEYYRTQENDKTRSDPCEGTLWSTNDIEFSTDPKFRKKRVIPKEKLCGPTTIEPDWTDRINLLCMCMADIDSNADDIPVSQALAKFGGYGVLITNPSEFLRRVRDAIAQINEDGMSRGPVTYSDTSPEDIHDKGIIFRKRKCYKDEHEYRIAFTGSDTQNCIVLETGSLADIAFPVSRNT